MADKLRRTLQAKVLKVSGDKSLSVQVERKVQHPIYKKVVRVHKKYVVHAENPADYQEGDLVVIGEIKPVSKRKSWEVINTVESEKK